MMLHALMYGLRCAVSAALVLGYATLAFAQADFSAELPRIPPTEPADALKRFEIAEGFQIQQVAAEPLVTSPVAIEWDATGRMYVCEMRGYSEDRDLGISRITQLQDTDNDGIYDRSVVFADNLLWPTAIFPFNGGLFVGDAPNIYYFKDTDGDGKADEKKVFLTGFSVSNVQGLMNSFRWGLDNRIHVASSSTGGAVKRPEDDDSAAVNVRGRDIAFDPWSGLFELTSGAAQHGMCFDDWGRKFTCSNSNHLQQVMYEDRYLERNPHLSAPPSRISIAADGPQAEVFRISPVEPWRIVRTRLRVGGLVPGPIEGGGRAAGYFTGATGLTIYRGDAWPEEMKGLAIIGDVGSNLIHRKRLEQNGLEFVGRRIDENSEFVASTDIWFRPAQFANAPDGSLHVIDVCREVIEHPRSLPPDIKKHLDLTAGRDRGRIYRIVPDGFKHRPTPNLKEASLIDLVNTLGHANAWHRETAARLLFERNDAAAIEPLRLMASSNPSPLGRLHALYALDGLGGMDDATLSACLADKHPQVRRHAIRLAELQPALNRDIAGEMGGFANDLSIEVRYQAAFSLGTVLAKHDQPLSEILIRDAGDRWIEAAVQSSLERGAGELMAALIGSEDYRKQGSSGRFLQKLADQISRQNRAEDIELVVSTLQSSNDASLLPAIVQLLKKRHDKKSVLSKLDQSGQLKPLDARVEQMIATAIETASSGQNASPSRLRAIETLAFGSLSDVQPTLAALIDTRQPGRVQQVAIKTLGTFNSPDVAPIILATWQQLSPQLRSAASDVLFARTDRTLALFDSIDAGTIAVADVGRSRLQIASKSKNADVKSRAEKFLEAAGNKQRGEVVDAYQSSLQMKGNVATGKTLFQKHCAVCHKVEGFGHEIGPNLATMKSRGPETILINVLDPNREVNPEFLNYIALTLDGRTMTGMIASENATSVTLRRAESATDTVLRSDLDQLKSTGLSIMPEGMEETISKQAMADIIAYLMQVK